MKRFVQYTAVLGAVLTVLGFGTASAAYVQGGRWNQMKIWEDVRMHQRAKVRGYSVPISADRGSALDEYSKSFPCMPEFSLEVDFGDVTIFPEETDRIIIRCGSSSDFGQVVWAYAEDSEIKLAVYGRRSENRKPEVTVIVPADYSFQEVDVEVGGGNCTIEGLKAREFSGETGGGILFIEEGEASQADFSCAAGEISYYGQVLQDVDIDCAAGNVVYSGEIFGDAEVDCAAGNVYLELPKQQESDFNYEIEGTGGSVQIEGKFYSGVVFEKENYFNAPRTMELQCAAGSIEIDFGNSEIPADEAEKMNAVETEVSVQEAEKIKDTEAKVRSTQDKPAVSVKEDIIEEVEEERTERRKR